MDDIRTSDVIQWQNEIMKLEKDNGELFSQTYAFEMLYWTGIREGELLALTPEWVVQLLRLQRGC